jgi:uncharacterized surface protein with fasciclin (FAS1) repeats
MSDKNILGGCCGTEFGCCPDGKTAKTDIFGTNCPCTCWKHPSSIKCPEPQCGTSETSKCCKKKCKKKQKYENGFDSCICDNNDNNDTNNLMQVISEKNNLSLFNTALNMTSLPETLSGTDEYTVFAPNDEAFSEIDNLDDILDDQELLTIILQLHIVKGEIKSSEIPEGETKVPTLNGQDIIVNNSNGITVSNQNNEITANVVQPDIDASNGVIHIIDKVLLPAEDSESSGGGNNKPFRKNIFKENIDYNNIYKDKEY